MKNLILSNLLLLLLSSCSFSLLNSYQRLPENGDQEYRILPWFQDNNDPVLYRTTLNIYTHHFGGLMVIKPVSDESHRVLLITEVGIKLFDMEFFRNGDFRLHYCLEALEKKAVIRTLKNDIGLMIYNVPDRDKKVKIFGDIPPGKLVIRQRPGPGTRYYFKEDSSKRVDEIVQTGITGKKVKLNFYGADDTVIDSVKISHYGIKLDIHLSALHESKPAISE